MTPIKLSLLEALNHESGQLLFWRTIGSKKLLHCINLKLKLTDPSVAGDQEDGKRNQNLKKKALLKTDFTEKKMLLRLMGQIIFSVLND